MKTFNGFLGRDALDDNGQIPYSGSPNWSPDMIFHKPVDNHKSYFKKNYSQDPNQAVQGDRKNHLYVRAKKLGPGSTAGTFRCYYLDSSLIMHPRHWVNNPIKTLDEKEEVILERANSSEVVVGDQAFLWQPPKPNQHYCIVGRIITPTDPNPIPPVIESFAALLDWVRNRPNICWRNLTIVNNSGRTWSSLKRIENLDNRQRIGYLMVEVGHKVPVNTMMHMVCPELGIEESWSIRGGSSRKHHVRITLPARFHGFIETRAYAPGTSWPNSAIIKVRFYILNDGDLDEFVSPEKNLESMYGIPSEISHDQGLVHLGTCAVKFTND